MAVLIRALGRPLCLALGLSALLSGDVMTSELSEAEVRAGMLYNFASFTEWPDKAPTERLIIGVVGNDAVAKALQSAGALGNGRGIDVRTLNQGEGLEQCQVLYVTALSDRAVAATLARVTSLPILTVGEQEHFTQLGGVIRVYVEGKRLRFEVDVAHAVAVRLKINSRVLNLARLVGGDNGSNP